MTKDQLQAQLAIRLLELRDAELFLKSVSNGMLYGKPRQRVEALAQECHELAEAITKLEESAA